MQISFPESSPKMLLRWKPGTVVEDDAGELYLVADISAHESDCRLALIELTSGKVFCGSYSSPESAYQSLKGDFSVFRGTATISNGGA